MRTPCEHPHHANTRAMRTPAPCERPPERTPERHSGPADYEERPDDPDNLFLLRMEQKILDHIALQGIKNVRKVFMRQDKSNFVNPLDPLDGYKEVKVCSLCPASSRKWSHIWSQLVQVMHVNDRAALTALCAAARVVSLPAMPQQCFRQCVRQCFRPAVCLLLQRGRCCSVLCVASLFQSSQRCCSQDNALSSPERTCVSSCCFGWGAFVCRMLRTSATLCSL